MAQIPWSIVGWCTGSGTILHAYTIVIHNGMKIVLKSHLNYLKGLNVLIFEFYKGMYICMYCLLCKKVLIHKSYGNSAVCSLARNRPRIKYSQVSSVAQNDTKAKTIYISSGFPVHRCTPV